MTERGRLLGRLEVRYYARLGDNQHGTPELPPGIGDAEVLWESHDPGATEARLKRWALDELTSEVHRIFGPAARPAVKDPPAAFPWPEVFQPGDVVRRREGHVIGIVLAVVDYSSQNSPAYELHVDVAREGKLVGVECWDPWVALRARDAESIAEAQRLGLRMPIIDPRG